MSIDLNADLSNGCYDKVDRDAVGDLAKKEFPYQRKASIILDERLPHFSLEYPRVYNPKNFLPYDVLVKPNLKIELEIGLGSHYWTDHLPLKCWRRGISVAPTRKLKTGRNGRLHWDVIIRFSQTLESFVAITSKYLLEEGELEGPIQHSTGFTTNDCFVVIPKGKDKNDDQDMCYDDFGLLEKLITNQLKAKRA
jgi:hypothetical protein